MKTIICLLSFIIIYSFSSCKKFLDECPEAYKSYVEEAKNKNAFDSSLFHTWKGLLHVKGTITFITYTKEGYYKVCWRELDSTVLDRYKGDTNALVNWNNPVKGDIVSAYPWSIENGKICSLGCSSGRVSKDYHKYSIIKDTLFLEGSTAPYLCMDCKEKK